MNWSYFDQDESFQLLPIEIHNISGEKIIEKIQLSFNGFTKIELNQRRIFIPSNVKSLVEITDFLLDFKLSTKVDSRLFTSFAIVDNITDEDEKLLEQLKVVLNADFQISTADEFDSYISVIKSIINKNSNSDLFYDFILLFLEYYSRNASIDFINNCNSYMGKYSNDIIFMKYIKRFLYKYSVCMEFSNDFVLYSFLKDNDETGSGFTILNFIKNLNSANISFHDVSSNIYKFHAQMCNSNILICGHGSAISDNIGNHHNKISLIEVLKQIKSAQSLFLLLCNSEEVKYSEWKSNFINILKFDTEVRSHIINFIIYTIDLESKRKLTIDYIIESCVDLFNLLDNSKGKLLVNS